MSDFRLQVFAAVARHLSFTKASQELFISQPAGASTTLSQYVLPAFQRRYPQVQLTLLSVNSERIAGALLRGELNLGFVEGRAKSRDLHYELLMPDELVAVRRATLAGPPPAPRPLAEVLTHPLVLRERGSGTLEVLEFAPRAQNQAQRPANSVSPRQYRGHQRLPRGCPRALGLVSRQALRRELAASLLEIVPVAGLELPGNLRPCGCRASH
jgi:DNA-binding transcriptional LysR family regulator